MTDHPAAGCTPRQIEVFEQIATGMRFGHPARILVELLDKGLIAEGAPLTDNEPDLGASDVFDPYVPIHHHHQFCSWASEQFGDDDDLEAVARES